jgi:hypothetical protein
MPNYVGALAIVLLLGMVLSQVFLLKHRGIKAMKFGSTDETDFLIPPFAFFSFYVLFATAFGWPNVAAHQFFRSEVAAWAGVLLCLSRAASGGDEACTYLCEPISPKRVQTRRVGSADRAVVNRAASVSALRASIPSVIRPLQSRPALFQPPSPGYSPV